MPAPKQIVDNDGVIVTVKVGAIDTVATAVIVQAPIPDKTVYVVVAFGVTVTFATLGGFAPVLAVQVNGPVPVEDKLVLAPKQMIVLEGVTLIVGVVPTDTVATADEVQLPVPDKTVYVVVTVGLTVTVLVLAGFVPELAVHVYGAGPLAVRIAFCPAQILVKEGVILIVGVKEIETVATADAVQLPVPDKTV